MSKRAEQKAQEYEKSLDYYHYTSDEPSVAYKKGYEQAEKDLALTWEDVAILITIYEHGVDNGDYRRYNEAEWMKEYSQDILRKFNEIRKK